MPVATQSLSANFTYIRLLDYSAAPLSFVLEAFTSLLAVALGPQNLLSRLVLGKVKGTTHVNIADTDTPRHD